VDTTVPAEPTVIELRRNYAFFALLAVLGLAMAVFLLWFGLTTRRGLVLWRVIKIGPEGARVLCVLLSLLGLYVLGKSITDIVQRATRPSFRIVVGTSGVTLPQQGKLLLGPDVTLLFPEIASVALAPQKRPRLLVLHANRGRYRVPGLWLPKGWNPARLADLLLARVHATRAA